MKLEGFQDKKNTLIRRLAALIEAVPVYTGAPDFAYDIGPYRVLRDGSLVVLEDDADPVVLQVLIDEKILSDPAGPAAPAEEALEIPTTLPACSDMDPQAALPDCSCQAVPDGTISAAPESSVCSSQNTITTTTEQAGNDFSGHNSPAPSSIVIKDRIVTVRTMVNLLNMLYAKGEILNRAILRRNAFRVDERVIADLAYERPDTFAALNRIMGMNEKKGLVKGIGFSPGSVTFSGFPATDDYAIRAAYERLAQAMYRYAAEIKWTSTCRQHPENEKFYFRSWLNRIGLTGPENRTFREILLKNLSGNSSYRTSDQLAAFRARRSQQRTDNLRAGRNQPAATAHETNPCSDVVCRTGQYPETKHLPLQEE